MFCPEWSIACFDTISTLKQRCEEWAVIMAINQKDKMHSEIKRR